MSRMQYLRRRFVIILILTMGWAVSFSSETETEDAAIDRIIEAYIDSQGGRERLETIFSLEVEGTMELVAQGLAISMIQKLQTPDKVYTRQDFPTLGRIENRMYGKQGWEWHPIAGERPLDVSEIEDLLDDANLQRDLRLREEYASVRLGGSETIEGVETTLIIFTDEQGREERWNFKTNGDLFQKIHTVSAGPGSEFEATERYYALEQEDGFRFPRRIRYINPAYEAELTIEELVINREIDPSFFELPEYAEEMSKLRSEGL